MALQSNPGTFIEARDYAANKFFNLTFDTCTANQKRFVNKWITEYIDSGSGRNADQATVGELYEIPRAHFVTYINRLAAQYPDVAAVAEKLYKTPAYDLDLYKLNVCIDTAEAIKTVYSPNVTDGQVYQFLQAHPDSILYGRTKSERATGVVSSWTINAKTSELEVIPE